MSDTIPRRPRDRHHLAPVHDLADDVTAAGEKLADITRLTIRYATAAHAKPVLRPVALVQLAGAEKFLLELEDLQRGADELRVAVLLGQAQGHLQQMVDLVMTVTELPR